MKIDRNSDIPIYIQIYNNIVDEIVNGYLIPEDRLVSRRRLCNELNVAQQTVENAYQKLVADGYVVSKPGSGYYVSHEQVRDDSQNNLQRKRKVYNFSTNGVETSKLPFQTWSKLLKSTVKDDTGLFQHGDKEGEWRLRKSIRRLLFRTQNIKCKTEQIIIGPGAEDLLRSIFALIDSNQTVIMNNYYNYRVNSAAILMRNRIDYVANDENGIKIDELNKYSNALLYQKPTHDLPTAVTMSEENRKALVRWAEKSNSYIIEDSADNDYQFGNKEKTLWELSGGKNIIYLGSFSRTIAPSVKIGYIVAPYEFSELWFKRNKFYANRVSRIDQVTLSKFIDLGYYEKHIKYMRDVYREKSIVVKNIINSSPIADSTRITGDNCGLYCNMHFDVTLSEEDFVKILLSNGVKLSSLTSSLYDKSLAVFPKNTYNIGYGDLKISEIREGLNIVTSILKNYLK